MTAISYFSLRHGAYRKNINFSLVVDLCAYGHLFNLHYQKSAGIYEYQEYIYTRYICIC